METYLVHPLANLVHQRKEKLGVLLEVLLRNATPPLQGFLLHSSDPITPASGDGRDVRGARSGLGTIIRGEWTSIRERENTHDIDEILPRNSGLDEVYLPLSAPLT